MRRTGPILVAAAFFLAGCAARRDQLPRVSADIESRTGHAPAAKADPRAMALPPGVSLDAGLTDEQAVAVALWNNPAF